MPSFTLLRLTRAIIAIATVLGPRVAAASEIRVERSNGAEACPDPERFEARARAGATERSRDVSIRFSRTKTGYASSIQTSDGMVRVLEDDACDALADATLVIVRLALDVERPSPPSPAPLAAASEPAKEKPSPDRNDRTTGGVEVLAGGAVAAGLGVSFAPGARLGASWLFDRRRWSIGLTGLALAPEKRTLERGSVELGLLGGGLEGCGRAATTSGVFAGALCARGEMFRLSGSADGFVRNEAHARPLFAMGVALRGKSRIAAPVSAFLEVAASVPLSRERFAIDGVGIVYEPPIVAGTAALGLAVDFE